MAKYRKLGRTSSQRKALLIGQVTELLYHGKIVTTEARAKEVKKIAEGLIALAVKEKDNYETVTVTAKVARKDKDGKRVRKQMEVDFVVNQSNRRYYIQSAFALPNREKVEQEQASLVKIPDSFKKIIVVGDNSPIWRNEEGVTIIGIYDFLLNNNSLDL